MNTPMTTPKEALEAALSVMQDAPKSVLRDCAIGEVEQVLASLEGDAVERVARIMVRNDPNYCIYHMPGDVPRDWKATSGYRDKTSELSEPAAESVRARARAILATGLVPDEAAIRADEREKLWKLAVDLTLKWGNPNGTQYEQGAQDHGHRLAAAIRSNRREA